MSDNRPIGVFDSGLGGLTVAAALSRLLPDENLLYLGDTARVPYGDKSPEAIREFVRQDVEFLVNHGVKTVVFGCNTASAVALESTRSFFPGMPMLGVIDAGIRAVLRLRPVGTVAVIGTRATVNSDSYRRGIHAADPSIVVKSIACPLLVPLAEEGFADSPAAELIIEHYLGRYRATPPDVLLLGCTHYPLFRRALSAYLGEKVRIVDSATACGEYVADFLSEHNLTAGRGNGGASRFYVTDLDEKFRFLAQRFLNRVPESVEKVSLG